MYSLFNCKSADAHAHSGSCSFFHTHFKGLLATARISNEDLFKSCMKIRLPELTRDYLMTVPTALRELVIKKCEGNMKLSPFFDFEYLMKLMRK